MQRTFKSCNCFILYIFILPVALFLTAEKSSAQEEECLVTILKVAPGAEGLEFRFDGVGEGGVPFTFFLTAGESSSGLAGDGTITEAPQHGYQFGGIECEPGGGAVITDVMENGWSGICENPRLETFCTVTNIPLVSPIPTLSKWGIIAAASGLMITGIFFALRRRRASAQI